MKLYSFQIIPGEHFPHTAIVDAMLQPDPEKQVFKHVRAGLVEFIDWYQKQQPGSVLMALVAWAEGLQSRVSDSA